MALRVGRRVSIVLPAYNEQDCITRALDHATEVADRLFDDHEIVVVDDGSTDLTAELVAAFVDRDPRVRLVRHPRNRGYGEALRTGFRSAASELIFLTDADLQFDLNELGSFLPWIDRVDVVAGYRIQRQDPWLRRVTAWAWNMIVRALFYVPVRDIDCAFKLFRREVFDRIDLSAVGAMVSTELMVKLGRSGAGVVEIGVTHYPRTTGQARGASPRVILRALYELFIMHRHLKGTEVTRSAPPPRLSNRT